MRIRYIQLEVDTDDDLVADILATEVINQASETNAPTTFMVKEIELVEAECGDGGWYVKEKESFTMPNMNHVSASAKYSAKWYMDRLSIPYCDSETVFTCPACEAVGIVYDAKQEDLLKEAK